MILTPDNEYCIVADACVLMPMPMCDTLLRLAEEPSFFRIAWSEQILEEVGRGLAGPQFGYPADKVDRRLRTMREAFPEAMTVVPSSLIEGISGLPDPGDRHIVALAIHAHAHTIVTDNLRHFPQATLAPHNLTALCADDFLVHQFHLAPTGVLEKLDGQATAIRQRRENVLRFLQPSAPQFCKLCASLR